MWSLKTVRRNTIDLLFVFNGTLQSTQATMALSDLDQAKSCQRVDPRSSADLVRLGWALKGAGHVPYTVVLSLEPEPGRIFARCYLAVHPLVVTYSLRKIAVTLDDVENYSTSGHPGATVDINVESLVMPRNFGLTGGLPGPNPAIRGFTDPGQTVEVTWDDDPSARARDLRLLLVGVLVGIGAGAVIEWVRPCVEHVSGR